MWLGAGLGSASSGPWVKLLMVGFGGETSEALVALARLGCSLLLAYWGLLGAVLGVVAMLEACTGYLSAGLLELLLIPPV